MSRMSQSVLSLTILLLAGGAVLAQRPGPEFRRQPGCDPLEPRTKLEALERRYERVLVKGFTQIASFSGRGADVRIDAVELKDIDANTRAVGLVIALRETGENPRENRSFVDYEEIDLLLHGIDAVGHVSESVTKLASFEARYRTLGDLEINVFRQSRSGNAVSLTSGLCDSVTAFLTLDELEKLRAHIVEARTRLDEIK